MDSNENSTSAGDLLYGVPAIAAHLGIKERQARHRCATGAIPTFRIGQTICSRQSTINRWLDEQERRGAGEDGE